MCELMVHENRRLTEEKKNQYDTLSFAIVFISRILYIDRNRDE